MSERVSSSETLPIANQQNENNSPSQIDVELLGGEKVKLDVKQENFKRLSYNYCSELVAEYQGKCVLVTKWTFSCKISKTRAKENKNSLEKFVARALNWLKTLDCDRFVAPYLFINLKQIPLNDVDGSNFKNMILYGQLIDSMDDKIVNIFSPNFCMQDKFPLMTATVVGVLKRLHSNEQLHGHVQKSSIWFNSKTKNFFLTDAILIPEILNFCSQFENNKAFAIHANHEDVRFRDVNDLCCLLQTIESQSPDEQEHLTNFIRRCRDLKSFDEFIWHEYLNNKELFFDDDSFEEEFDSTSDNSTDSTNYAFSHTYLVKNFYAVQGLGSGGFGHVILARDKILNKDFAIKYIKVSDIDEKNARREIEVLEQLHHVHIVRYFSSWIEEGSNTEEVNYSVSQPTMRKTMLYIQMEFCNQNNLRKWIDEHEVDRDTLLTWRLFHEILLGLEYIHEKEIMHRDIKPENIFLDRGTIKIGDFGLARFQSVKDSYMQGAAVQTGDKLTADQGTSVYRAPEVRKSGDYNKKCDVYSTGIVLFEMFHHFPTSHERIEVLSNLETFFLNNDKLNVEKKSLGSISNRSDRLIIFDIVKHMIKFNTNERPAVKDLLTDERIPVVESVELKFDKQHGQSIKTYNSRIHRHIVSNLFATRVPRDVTDNYDKDFLDNNLHIRSQQCSIIERELLPIFSFYCFDKLHLSPLTPKDQPPRTPPRLISNMTADYPLSLKSCKFLDSYGIVVTFQSDMRASLHKYCIQNNRFPLRRFDIGQVFVASNYPERHPNYSNECVVDFIVPQSQEPLPDRIAQMAAEMLVVAIDIGNKISCISNLPKNLRIGHKSIINIVKTIEKEPTNIDTIEKEPTNSDTIEKEPINMLTETLGSRSNFSEWIKKLKVKAKNPKLINDIKTAETEINKFLEFTLQLIDISTMTVVFDATHYDRKGLFSHGIVFSVDVPCADKKKNSTDVLIGGQYKIQRSFKYVEEKPLLAIGMNIHIDVLCKIEQSWSPPSSCQILVYGDASINSMKIVSQLRRPADSEKNDAGTQGFRTSSYAEGTIDECLAYAQKEKILFVLALDESKDTSKLYENVEVSKTGRPSVKMSFAEHRIQTVLSDAKLNKQDVDFIVKKNEEALSAYGDYKNARINGFARDFHT